MSVYVFICETRRKAPCWARQADSFLHLPLTTPQGQLRLELLRLESESTTAQPISAQLCYFFSYQHCIPQSSAVIKHLKESVNWDDGIENDTEYLSVRVGEYFGPCVEKRKEEADLQTETDVTRWLWMPLFTFKNSLVHLSHTSLRLSTAAMSVKGEISSQRWSKKGGKQPKKMFKHIPEWFSLYVTVKWTEITIDSAISLPFSSLSILMCNITHQISF